MLSKMMPFSKKILPVPLDSGLKMDDYWVWCGSVLEDSLGGFHIYAARWPKKYPMFEGYILCSEVVRAFSENIYGPYHFVEKILPSGDSACWSRRMVHNPTAVHYKNKFLLYYIGSTYEYSMPEPENIDMEALREIYSNIKIGLAISEHPGGPWNSLPSPIFESRPEGWDNIVVTNPAPCVHPDGRIFLYYRSNTPDGLRIGLAVADNPEGPYKRNCNGPIMQGINIEDPFVWHNGSYFEMIAKDMTGNITGEFHSGAHFVSDDGITWKASPAPKAYSRKITFTDGSSVKLGCLERPQLLFDENRTPKCMFAAAADGPGGFRNAKNTWNIAIPLK